MLQTANTCVHLHTYNTPTRMHGLATYTKAASAETRVAKLLPVASGEIHACTKSCMYEFREAHHVSTSLRGLSCRAPRPQTCIASKASHAQQPGGLQNCSTHRPRKQQASGCKLHRGRSIPGLQKAVRLHRQSTPKITAGRLAAPSKRYELYSQAR